MNELKVSVLRLQHHATFVSWAVGPLLALGMVLTLPQSAVAQPGSAGALSREERLRQHRERISKILEERRKQEAANQASATPAPAGAAAAAPAAGAAGAAQAGSPSGGVPAGVRPPGEATPPRPGGIVPPAGGAPGGAPGQNAGAARTESRAILALYPFDSSIQVGDTFETEVLADVRTGAGNEISFTLSWPANELNLLAMNHGALASLGVREFEYGVDGEKGVLSAKVELPEARSLSGQPLLKLVWEGIRPSQASEIRFRFDAEVPTEIKSGSENILGTSFGQDDGVLHSVVLIRPRAVRVQAARTKDGGVVLGAEPADPNKGFATLRLEQDKREVRTGDAVLASVVLDNPDQVPFDRIRLYLQYDPERLEALDTDRGNAVQVGTNIREGDRTQFPFDYLRSNRVESRHGVIEFDAGTELKAIETTGGVVARVAFMALKPGRAEVTLVRNGAGLAPTTDVIHQGVSVLDAPAPGARPVVLGGVNYSASGTAIARSSGENNQVDRAGGEGSTILFSSGLGKGRQFGSVSLKP